MSNAWDTKVTIERVEITPFTNFKFHNFFIQDHAKDTLIFAKYAEADNYNLFALFNKTIDIGHVDVQGAVFKVQRQPEAEFFNIHFLIAFFEGPADGGPRPKKFKFSMGGATLYDARIHLADTAIGTSAVIVCDTGYVLKHPTKGVDMIGKKVWANKTHLSNASITVRVFDKVEIPNMDSTFGEEPVDSTIPYWDVGCEKLLLNNVTFKLINERPDMRPDSTRVLDFSNLDISNIDLDVDSFRLQKEVFTGQVRQLKGIDKGNFQLKSFRGNTTISPTKLAFSNFRLVTNTSSIGHALTFKYSRYSDFYDFPNKVKILGTLDSSTFITFKDIAAFAPAIEESVFIASNLDKPIEVQGQFKGTINNFRARNVVINVGDYSHIKGNISMNDITQPGAAFMDLKLKSVYTDYAALKDILPFVKLPSNLANLGRCDFSGSYTGFFQDFVAYGMLDTRIGSINSDLQLNLRKGKTGAAYKGGIMFNDFDLGRFLNQPDVGRISMRSNVKGLGLTLETLDATLQNARIDSFLFKNYTYRDLNIDGQFKQKRFDGDIASRDTNMYVFVRGIMDLNGELPSVDIRGSIENIDFQKVNISQESIGLHLDTFDINVVGSNLDNFTGYLSIRGIDGHRGDVHSNLNRIVLKATNPPEDTITVGAMPNKVKPSAMRVINLKSDVLDVNVFGHYDIVNLVRSLERFIRDNHPNLYRELYKELPQAVLDSIATDSFPPQDFNILVNIPKTTKNLTQLIDKNFKSLEKVFIIGEYIDEEERLDIHGEVGKVSIGDITIRDINLEEGRADGSTFQLNSNIKSLDLQGKSFIPNIHVELDAIGDSVRFFTSADSLGNIAQDLSIHGKLEINEKLVVLKLDTSNLKILNEVWTVNDNNHIKVGDQVLDIKDVALSNGSKKVTLSSINDNKGAQVELQNISLGWLYGFMEPLPKIEIDGVVSGKATIQNVFKQQAIDARINFDTLIINDDYWGSNSVLVAKADSVKSTFRGRFTHSSDFVDSLEVYANFTPKFATKNKGLKNLLDINIGMTDGKAKILEYFLKEQIYDTKGLVNAKARVFGNLNGKKTVMNIEGGGDFRDVQTTVNFLQTTYAIDPGKVIIDNSNIKIASDIRFINGNEYAGGGVKVREISEPTRVARLSGGLVHNHLKDFGLDLIAWMDKNLVLNTTLEDNNTFYGRVHASGTAAFTGPFERLKLKVDAITENDTEFNLPIGGPLEVTETNYIQFIDKNAKVDSSKIKSIKEQILAGLDIEINADIRPSAVARMIIDEQAGDIIQGSGRSDNMRISYSPTGELKIFGTYEIVEGNYLFTYKNLINKPFDVQPGGTISWGADDGDPYKAQLNMKAIYEKGLGVGNLVKSYTVNNSELSSLANKPYDVKLLMGLTGELFSPEIDFDIEIHNVAPALQNPVGLALRTIRSDKNELNRQVFGIIALQQFLPLENAQDYNVVSSGIDAGISTVSELVSQQLSLYVNDLLEGVIKEVDFISSLEFDFNFNIRETENQTISTNTRTSNVRVGSDIKFLNDKLRFYAGANMDIVGNDQGLQNVTDNANYVGGDFILEYYITPDGRLKIKAYNRSENTILGPSVRTGIGISYRKEFNTLQDLIDEGKKARQDAIDNRIDRRIKRFSKKQKKLNSKIKELHTITTPLNAKQAAELARLEAKKAEFAKKEAEEQAAKKAREEEKGRG